MTSLKEKLHPNQANHLNKTGGTVLCWDVPSKIYFGIDYLTFETGSKFKGVKMIPPGAHFIHTSVHNAERMGFFVWLSGKQIDVYQWDTTLSFLIDFADKEQADRLRIGVRNFDFDSMLGAYPLQTYSKWQRLSSHINKHLIKRLGPTHGIITSTYSEIQQISMEQDDDDEMKGNALNEEYNLAKSKFEAYHPKYTKIPCVKSFNNLEAAELTALQLDRSKILNDVWRTHFKDSHFELLGELQYAFICLLVGQSVQGLEQWKDIIDLLTNCLDALQNNQPFYIQFVDVFMHQLKALPKDFFRDVLTNKNFLNQSLQAFMEIVSETELNLQLSEKIAQLKHILAKRFDKIFDVDTDGPIVVALH